MPDCCWLLLPLATAATAATAAGIRARALPFLESLEVLEAPKTSYFSDLEHLAVAELSLDLIGPAADTGTIVGHRGLFSPQSLRLLAEVARRYPTLHIIINHTAGERSRSV